MGIPVSCSINPSIEKVLLLGYNYPILLKVSGAYESYQKHNNRCLLGAAGVYREKNADSIIQTYHNFGSPMDCLIPLLESCTGRRKAILHIYRSVHREAFFNQLERIIFYVVTQYINTVTADLMLSSEDRELFIRFYKCTLTGIFLDWLNAGMEYDLSVPFTRICLLFGDAGKRAFLKSAELMQNQ